MFEQNLLVYLVEFFRLESTYLLR